MDVEREERRWNGKSGIRLMIFVRIDDLFSGLFTIGAVGSWVSMLSWDGYLSGSDCVFHYGGKHGHFVLCFFR